MPQVNLKAAPLDLLADAGDVITVPFSVVATNTTGWTVIWELYAANDDHDGPTGDLLSTGSVTNTPNTEGGNSSLSMTLDEEDTEEYAGETLWLKVIRTSDPRRTLAKGPLKLD